MEVRDDGVAVITISNPPVNALSYDGINLTVLCTREFLCLLSFSWLRRRRRRRIWPIWLVSALPAHVFHPLKSAILKIPCGIPLFVESF